MNWKAHFETFCQIAKFSEKKKKEIKSAFSVAYLLGYIQAANDLEKKKHDRG